jgi:CRP-like cAMP-binding protein
MDFELLFAQLETKIREKLSVDDKQLLRSAMRQRIFLKRQCMLQEGDICAFMGFIVSGAGRVFSIDDRGFEHTLCLCIEGHWILDFESFHWQKPAAFYIEMLEASQLLLLQHGDFLGLQKTAPRVFEALRIIELERHIASWRRLHTSISLSASERYEEFKHNSPDFVSRFPQGMIASFLGITAETLSRIRRQTRTVH